MVPGEVSCVRREVAQKLFGRLAGAVVRLFSRRSLAREVARWLRVTVGVQGGHGNMEVRHGDCSGLCPGDGVGSTLFPKRKKQTPGPWVTPGPSLLCPGAFGGYSRPWAFPLGLLTSPACSGRWEQCDWLSSRLLPSGSLGASGASLPSAQVSSSAPASTTQTGTTLLCPAWTSWSPDPALGSSRASRLCCPRLPCASAFTSVVLQLISVLQSHLRLQVHLPSQLH